MRLIHDHTEIVEFVLDQELFYFVDPLVINDDPTIRSGKRTFGVASDPHLLFLIEELYQVSIPSLQHRVLRADDNDMFFLQSSHQTKSSDCFTKSLFEGQQITSQMIHRLVRYIVLDELDLMLIELGVDLFIENSQISKFCWLNNITDPSMTFDRIDQTHRELELIQKIEEFWNEELMDIDRSLLSEEESDTDHLEQMFQFRGFILFAEFVEELDHWEVPYRVIHPLFHDRIEQPFC